MKDEEVVYPAGFLAEVSPQHYHLYAKSLWIVKGNLVDGMPMSLAVVSDTPYEAQGIVNKIHPNINTSVRKATNRDKIFTGTKTINLCLGEKSIFG